VYIRDVRVAWGKNGVTHCREKTAGFGQKMPSLPCKARANPTPSQTLRKCLAAGSESALQLLTKTEPN